MKLLYGSNPAPVIGRKGEPGWPELRGEIHSYANGLAAEAEDASHE